MKGILLLNLGTPDAPTRGAVYRYLKQFLLDPRVIDINPIARNLLVRGIIAPFRSGKSAKAYQLLWTPEGSPIKIYGHRLKAGVQEILGEGYKVALGMRYQSPSVESALEELLEARCNSILVFPLFPQYASASTGSVLEEVMRLLSKEGSIPNVQMVNSYHDMPEMISVFAANGAKHDPSKFDHILFSFHGLPQRQLRKSNRCGHCLQSADCCQTLSDRNQFCYSAQCHATAFAIAKELGLPREKFTVCYQSRLGRDPWVQPYTTEVLKERARLGDKRLLVFSPAFVADCLETLVEISDEYQEEWEHLGGEHVQLVESLNDNPAWIKAVADFCAKHA